MNKEKQQPALTLYQKLIEIRKEVEYVQHDADGHRFKYSSDTAIIAAIRPKMDQLGVILDQEMVNCELVDGKKCRVDFLYHWIDSATGETIVRKQTMFDADASEQGLGKAMTYGLRYFLYKSMLVATASDDPDVYKRKQDEKNGKEHMSDQQIFSLLSLIGTNQKLYQEILDGHQVTNVSDIPADQFNSIFNRTKVRLSNAGS